MLTLETAAKNSLFPSICVADAGDKQDGKRRHSRLDASNTPHLAAIHLGRRVGPLDCHLQGAKGLVQDHARDCHH